MSCWKLGVSACFNCIHSAHMHVCLVLCLTSFYCHSLDIRLDPYVPDNPCSCMIVVVELAKLANVLHSDQAKSRLFNHGFITLIKSKEALRVELLSLPSLVVLFVLDGS